MSSSNFDVDGRSPMRQKKRHLASGTGGHCDMCPAGEYEDGHGTAASKCKGCPAAYISAAGANGLLVEFHPDPGRALSDGPQALDRAGLLALGASCAAPLEVA